MAKTRRTAAAPLIDAVRPLDADGPLVSLICSTYGLSLDQPNFFEQDFLPTALGLGGVRDRGYAVPVAMERKLKEVYSAVIADAHALAGGARPSLQIDVLPIGHRTNHAKVVLVHRKRLIRLVIASANLTHDGYRRQREVGAILDFKEGGRLPLEVLRQALTGWSDVLGELCTEALRRAFAAALRQAEGWDLPAALPENQRVEVQFGGGSKPLWQTLVEAWPRGEPLLDWCVCSPFWPDASGRDTPFEAITRGLAARGARVEEARLSIVACADSPGERGRPKFPFPLLRHLYENDFPVRRGQVAAARLEALRDEVPEGMAEDQRELHAKWVLLRGPHTAVALLGSANFTRKGLGVVARQDAANLEACVILTMPAVAADPRDWAPPLAEAGIVDLASFQESQFQPPAPEEDERSPWPDFLARAEVEVRWTEGAEPVGAVRIVPRSGPHPAFAVALPPEPGDPPPPPLLRVNAGEETDGTAITADVGPAAVRRMLARRMLVVNWGDPSAVALFPVNIEEHSKAGLPSVLGARPDEQQLLAYLHGRISEEELIESLERRAAEALASARATTSPNEERLRQLQSYLLRDFVESLYGLADTLRQSTRSPRAFEQAMVGDFSPVSLAEQVLQAFRAGRRSPTAAAFQFVELIRVAAELPLDGDEPLSAGEREGLEQVRARGVARLLALAGSAGDREDFHRACMDSDFRRYVEASLPGAEIARWAILVLKEPSAAEPPTDLRAENSPP
jgi:hypothetical protein